MNVDVQLVKKIALISIDELRVIRNWNGCARCNAATPVITARSVEWNHQTKLAHDA